MLAELRGPDGEPGDLLPDSLRSTLPDRCCSAVVQTFNAPALCCSRPCDIRCTGTAGWLSLTGVQSLFLMLLLCLPVEPAQRRSPLTFAEQ